MQHDIVYLACPYSHANMDVRVQRFEASARAAAELIQAGLFVYSPITMTHPIDLVLADEGGSMGSGFWCDFDEAFMNVCSEMIILVIEGWDNSNGIKREIQYFREQGKAIRYMMPSPTGSYRLLDKLEQPCQ